MVTAHMTPRASAAIIQQLAYQTGETDTRYANINGLEHEFTIYLLREWRRDHLGKYAEVEIIGASAEDPDTGEVAWAGNRVELDALLTEKLVVGWEDDIAQISTDKGEWAC